MDTSFKAVVFNSEHKVLLGTNPRSEWELLGGRADPEDRGPEDTIRRELFEEAGLDIVLGSIVDIWYYDIAGEGRVAVASYLAEPASDTPLTASHEHGKLAYFAVDQIDDLQLPGRYKTTIRRAQQLILSQREKGIR